MFEFVVVVAVVARKRNRAAKKRVDCSVARVFLFDLCET